jgi:hypothetical protein
MSTQVLFWIVIFIVVFGLALTLVQFRRDYSQWQHPATIPRKPDVEKRVFAGSSGSAEGGVMQEAGVWS